MNEEQKKVVREFMENKVDFGKQPSDYTLTEDQKKIAAITMGVQAAIVQLMLEGVFDPQQQMHLMSHLQDFTQRIYDGEDLKLPGVGQTLQINSKAGNLFYEAAEEAIQHGHETFEKIKELSRQVQEQQTTEQNNEEQVNAEQKHTLH